MIMKRLLGALLMVLMFSVTVNAQKNYKKEADAVFSGHQYFQAIEMYKKAYAKEKKNDVKAEILFQIAECYRLKHDDKQAVVWYNKAIKAKHDDDIALLHVANLYKSQGKYEEAIVAFNKYKAAVPGDKRAESGIKSSEMAKGWKDNPTRVVVNPMPLLNSEDYDYSPMFGDKKNQVLYFTSTRQGSTGSEPSGVTGMNFPDLYMSKRDKKGKWSEPVTLNETVNSDASEATPSLNKKKNMIFFTRCEVKKKEKIGCGIMWAKKAGQKWGEPEAIVVAADTFAVVHPAVSNDDNTIVFSANIPGGKGGMDLWYITYNKKAKSWSEPTNLGAEINTSEKEVFPYIRSNGDLYFSSNGHPGMGGLDLFKATNKGVNQWSSVENLKSPMNSESDDFGIVYEGDKKRGFFTTGREGGKGGDDIWEFYDPPLLFSLEGTVRNLETGENLTNAKVKLIGTDGSSAEIATDENGYFIFAENGSDRYVNKNTSYSLIVSKDKYLIAKGKETTVGLTSSKKFVHEYSLQPVTEKTIIKLPLIQYKTGSAELQDQYKDSLNFLYDIMVENPTIIIELRSHTDHRGSGPANQKLSQRRAQSCVDYLVKEKGIDAARIKAKGMGENEPLRMADGTLLTEKTIKALPSKVEQDAALQRNRRTDFKVLSFDFVPKTTLEN